MSEISVRVVDPGGERTAQLLDDRAPVRELVAVLVVRLALPRDPNYRLIDESAQQMLDAADTLGGVGVTHGDVLRPKVVNDSSLDFVLKQLYKQARKQARKKLWQLVREKLDAIRRLDPAYPDPDGLEARADAALGFNAALASPPAVPPPMPPPVPATPPPAPGAAKATGAGGCLKLVLVSVIVVSVIRNWDEIRT